jgi:hypothetical protein
VADDGSSFRRCDGAARSAEADGACPPSATKRAAAHRTITNNVAEFLTASIVSLLKLQDNAGQYRLR